MKLRDLTLDWTFSCALPVEGTSVCVGFKACSRRFALPYYFTIDAEVDDVGGGPTESAESPLPPTVKRNIYVRTARVERTQ